MRTVYEIKGNKTFKELSFAEREELQDRQTFLVLQWQDSQDPVQKQLIEDELYDSVKNLIKSMAHKESKRSFSVEKEDFVGIISLVFAETLRTFDRKYNKPFQPVFITYAKYAILAMYREKKTDLHDLSMRLDNPYFYTQIADDSVSTKASELPHTATDFTSETETSLQVEKILSEVFGVNDRKKIIIRMVLQGYKRNEIVSAINVEGKTPDSVARFINRTETQFYSFCRALKEKELI